MNFLLKPNATLICLLLIAPSLLFAAPPIKTPGPTKADDGGQVEGSVLSCQPFGLEDIEVYVRGESIVAKSDANGAFALLYVPPGLKDLTFAKDAEPIKTLVGVEVTKRSTIMLDPFDLCTDADADGFDVSVDCDDDDPEINPAAYDGIDIDWSDPFLPVYLYLDNDCDGIIDDDVKDTLGRYVDDTSCGVPGNDCTLLIFGGLGGVCNSAYSFNPICSWNCAPNSFDANANPADGCECADPIPTDVPDAFFVDANCDGLDGMIERGIFVSTDGNDIPLTEGGGTKMQPLRTIQYAYFQLVMSPGKEHVYMAKGVYFGFPHFDGFWGGYDDTDNWERKADQPLFTDPFATIVCLPGTVEVNLTYCDVLR